MKKSSKGKRIASAALAFSMVLTMLAGAAPASAANADTEPPAPWGPTPSASQVKYQKDGLSAFVHFGVNTFTGKSWGDGTEDPNIFNPTDLDADQWVKTMKDAGFKKLIMIAKHHDGFCLWQSAVTEHDVGSSTDWQKKMGGSGDVLKEVSKACTKYDMDMGVYLSPWDQNATCYGYGDGAGDDFSVKEGDYNLFYEAQLRELLGGEYGNNGKITEVWMDGAKGSGQAAQDYRFLEWFDLIEELQPGCLVFSPYASTVRWIGNESGTAGDPCWSRIDQQRIRTKYDNNGGHEEASYLNNGDPNGDIWSVGECDVSLTSGWFWTEGQQPKNMSTLTNIYFNSVGHGQPLLLNVPPDTDGKFQQDYVDRVAELGDTIQQTFENDFSKAQGVTATASAVRGKDAAYAADKVLDGSADTYWTMDDGQTTGSITIDLGGKKTFDVVSIEEYIQLGQRISDFHVEVHTDSGWQSFGSGHTIGAKRLVRSMPVKADQVRITIDSAQAVPLLSNVGVFKASGEFAMGSSMPDGLSFLDNTGFANTGTWHQESPAGTIGGTSMWADAAGSASSFTFTGSKAWILGTKDPNHGIMEVWIDGEKIAEPDTYQANRQLAQILYVTPDLDYKEHTVKLVVKGGNSAGRNAVGLDCAYYLVNHGVGMFELDPSSYSVTEGESAQITIRRVGGTVGEASVQFDTTPNTATDGRDYREIVNHVVTFADGQDTETITVSTIDNENVSENLSFFCDLSNPKGGAVTGFSTRATVTIRDNDVDLNSVLPLAREKREGTYTGASWLPFAQALAHAEEAASNPASTAAEKSRAALALSLAMDALTVRTGYSGEDPFAFPAQMELTKLLEGEHFILVPITGDYVRITEDANASGGKKIGWFEKGNQIKLPFTAAKAGTYTLTMTYQSGRGESNPNKLNWSGTHIKEGSFAVPGSGSERPIPFLTASFDIEVTQPGAGELIFTADAQSSPNIDKFEVSAKELTTVYHTIQASAGDHGSISPAGEVQVEESTSQTFTMTPDEGYSVADVLVNGESVGAVSSYTFDNVTEDATIAVSFTETILSQVNKSTLETVLNLAKAHSGEVEGLIPSAQEMFNKVLDKAQAVYDSAASTQDEVDKAWKDLMNAIHALGFVPGEKAELIALIAQAQTMDLTGYQDGTEKDAFKTALQAAVDTRDDADAMQADIDAALKALQTAIDNLIPVEKAGDKTELRKVIATAEGYDLNGYVQDETAIANFNAALAAANVINDKTGAIQSEIDGARLNLITAMTKLRLRADKASLNEWIEKLKAIDLSQYTVESADAVRAAIASAEALAAQDLGTDEMYLIQAEILKMQLAEAGLQPADKEPEDPKDDESGKPEEPSEPTDPKEDNSSKTDDGSKSGDTSSKKEEGKTPTTGDGAPIAILSLLAAATAGVMLAIKKRKV